MGNDKLSIVSMNSARKGLYSLPGASRIPYLQRLFETTQPDICLLPGDDKSAKLNVIRGYEQYMTPNKDDTILLYDSKKVSMTTADVSLSSFGPLPELDFSKIVCPKVEVSSLMPFQSPVKEFSLVTWDHTLFPNTIVNKNDILMESLLTFSLRLAMTTQLPFIVAGEINIEHAALENIVKKLSKECGDNFLQTIQPEMATFGFLQSMTSGATRDTRHKFTMNVVKCSNKFSNGKKIINDFVPDCFIASKILELTEPSLVDLETVFGRHIKMETVKTYCPTQTSMSIPVRPPKHHGG